MTDEIARRLEAAGLRVKPLVWHEGDEPDEWKSGPYDVWVVFGEFQLLFWGIDLGNPHGSADAAKTAAQADYTARILAALEMTGLAEAVKDADNG